MKVCGIVSEEDAAIAAQAGAAYVGAIMAAGFTRSVTAGQARAIFDTARQHGAEPVGVFVEETAEQILDACAATGLQTVQLHGTEARSALAKLPPELQVGLFQGHAPSAICQQSDPCLLQVFYVMHVSSDGELVTKLPQVTAELQSQELRRHALPAAEAYGTPCLQTTLAPAHVCTGHLPYAHGGSC